MTTRRYAAETTVSTDASIAEIRKLCRRYGAAEFMHAEGDRDAAISFTMKDRRILFRLRMPDPNAREFTHTPERGKARTASAATEEWERACRSRWRALALVVKAKLEAVEIGIVSFDDEFLGHFVMPGTSVTFGEAVKEKLIEAHRDGAMTPLLPFLGK